MNISDIKPEHIKELLKKRLNINSQVFLRNGKLVNSIEITLDDVLVEKSEAEGSLG